MTGNYDNEHRDSAPGTESSPGDARLTENHRPAGNAPRDNVIPTIVAIAIAVGFLLVFILGRYSASGRSTAPGTAGSVPAILAASDDSAPVAEPREPAVPAYDDPGPMGLAEIQEKQLIVDVHEHIQSIEQAPMFLAAMDRLGVQTVCLMGTSKFTLTLNESYGFTEFDENNEELIKIIEAYPGRFEAWPTVDPEDPAKLEKIQDLVARGATGVKLYIGHGYVTREHEYMFHTVAIDDPMMLPLYAWCEANYIPMVLHVNPYGKKKGFAQEFIAVLTRYPDLKVIAPHFILSSVSSYRMRELLDHFPNLYSDISFGDYFMKERLRYISKFPHKFRRIFEDYPDRFMFATDLVMIEGRTDDWAPTQFQAYIDMLSKETYTTAAIPGETLNGLSLSDDLLSRILFRNYRAFRAARPSGTEPIGTIDWERMSQEPVEREPGEAFPPVPE